ncbi:MAG TPA: hypothetical protein VNW68_04470 [Candidatus Limnocylindria bacterium]|nr:hypothetical protein [Candidatus Limnocylindria bacterium]
MAEARSGMTPGEKLVLRAARRRRWRLRVFGTALIVYGVIGVALFVITAASIGRPIEHIAGLTSSVEEQRQMLLETLDQAAETMEQAAAGVGGMDASLVQAQIAVNRAASVSRGTAQSMYELAASMGVEILGFQPMIGLAGGFQQTGDQLIVLADDVSSIGNALELNRGDARQVSAGMNDLAASIDRLGEAIDNSPGIEVSAGAMETLQLGLLAILAWLGVLAAGCVLAGLGMWWTASRELIP